MLGIICRVGSIPEPYWSSRSPLPLNRIGDLAFAFEGDTDAVICIAVRLFTTDGAGVRTDPEHPLYEEFLTEVEIQSYRDTGLDTGNIRVEAGTPLELELEVAAA